MRSIVSGAVLLASAASLLSAQAKAPAPKPAARPAVAVAPVDIDTNAVRRADTLRDIILRAAAHVSLGDSTCNPGTLRTFPSDSSGRSVTDKIADLERLVLAASHEEPRASDAIRSLLATVVAWEVDARRPAWDDRPGAPRKTALGAGLTGEGLNPETKKCEPFVNVDTNTIVIPRIEGFQPPAAGKIPYSVATGDEGLRSLRDRFFSRHAADERAILQYTRVTVLAQWLDYGVVTIDRPMERQGAMQLREGQGGATYLFHRLQGEWRLLAIVRTWS